MSEQEMIDIDYSEKLHKDGLIGFYIHYYGDENKFPQRAVIVKNGKIVKLIPRTSGDEEFVDTIWCGFCVEADDTCSFRENGKSVPRCLRRRREND